MEADLNFNYTFDEYVNHFHVFLEEHNLRKTYERNIILHTIYEFEEHFTIDLLQEHLKYKKYHVSRTTLYKTLNLLIDAGLIIKHHFPSQATPQYEKSHITGTHNHIYMEDTNIVMEFSDSRIEEIIKSIESKYNVSAIRHSFIVYCTNKEGK